jgi:hypothetical protein
MKTYISITLFFIASILVAQSPITKTIGEFTEVKAFDLINVTMIKSDKNEVVVEGKNKRDVEVVNNNGKLKIRMNIEEIYDGSDTDVTLYYTKVDIIDANEGAKIIVNDRIDQFEIELRAQEGGEITAEAKVSEAKIKVVTGGIINLSGSSKRQDVTIFTGGVFEAKDFVTVSTKISVNAGGEASIHATELAEVKVRAGGDVMVYGKPKEIDEKRVLGGRVKRM